MKSSRPTPARPAPADDRRKDKGNGHSLEGRIYAFDSFPDPCSMPIACRDSIRRNDKAIVQVSFLFPGRDTRHRRLIRNVGYDQ